MHNIYRLLVGHQAKLFCKLPVKVGITRHCSKINNNILEITFNNVVQRFPAVWLRDNCQCEDCFHKDSQSRIIDWKTFDVNVAMEYVENSLNKESIMIKWSDGHVSTFNKKWLSQRNFSQTDQDFYLKSTYRQERCTWNKSNFNSILHKYKYESILNEDKHLKDWLQILQRFGVATITKVPEIEYAGTNIANRVQLVKETHYGKKFVVKAKPGTTNVAYLSTNLQMHTDLPYYEYKPGVNLLHCVTQAKGEGGENLLTDGLFVAQYLKSHHTNHYKVLSNVLVDWEDIGKEGNNKFHSLYRSPVICEDLNGDIVRINHSVPQRGSHFNTPIEKVQAWYEAMKVFVDMIYENAVTYKMSPGEILCFDNLRLLHGRQEYQDTLDNTRYVIGVYVDWDFIHSRIRVLSEE